ncbi:MAG TPA: histidine kinase [Casimicrobiaceae bacterium]|nr:histidine kinase [Casimicrobiaceae bacterium]
MLAVNALAAVAALVRDPHLELWIEHWLPMMAFVEPHLIIELTLLYALAPWIARLSYPTGVFAVGALTVAIGIGVHVLLGRDLPQPPRALASYLVLTLIVFGALVGYFALRAKALSPAITESRLQALQARIRPHFLFNSINAVLSLVRNDPKQAESALLDMADLFRVLMRDNRELVPLNDEIALCQQYLALEKLRLGDRLQVDWHLNSMPSDALVPPLLLQPLLENAVYHGIEPSSTPGVISINIFYRGGEVHAILRNPYQSDGGNHHAGNKMALGNIRERLTLHFDAEASLESRVRDATYEVHIQMPYRSLRDVRKAEAETPVRGERANGERRGVDTRAASEGPRTVAGGNAGASRG